MAGDEKKALLTAASAVLFLVSGSQQSFAVFLLPLSRELTGANLQSLSMAIALFMVASGVSLPLVGILADVLNPRLVVSLGAATAGISLALLGFSSTIWHVYVLYSLLFGFTWNSSGLIASTALVSRVFPERKAVPLTVLQAAFPAGWLILVPISMLLIKTVGWRVSISLLGVLILSSGLALWLISRGIGPDNQLARPMPDETRLVTALRSKFYLVLGIATQFLCGFSDIPFAMLWVPLSLEWGIREEAAAYALGLVALLVLLGTLLVGPLPQKIGYKKSYLIPYIVRVIALAAPTLSRNLVSYYIFAAMLGISYFGMVPVLSAWLGDVFGERSVGRLLGLSTLVHYLGAATGVAAYSTIAGMQSSYFYAYVLALIASLAIVLMAVTLKEKGDQINY